ncbi:MAG: hypothetical protein K9L17_05980 [Clostridiales bacterium]|nr:hypothetical protein [Clostridiales bacterium]MCF8022221.1 hypothetical protein [Clostridiales bacterium]
MIFKSGRIFVPVRFVTQNFGCAVNFIKEKGQFVITVNNKGNKLQAPENVISRAGKTTRYINKYEMSSTAYTYTGHNTATGISPRRGIVAVDPEVIPLGTRLYVEGYGYCVALDTGGAVKGKRIDLFMQTRSKALRWGRRNVNVYVLESNEAS